jgi:putative aldouronate transport system substrate-binding protein
MADWYAKGYNDTDGPTLERSARDANITSGVAGLFQMNSGQANTFYDLMKETIPEANLYGVVPFVGPAGKPYGTNNAHIRYAASNEGTVVTQTAVENGTIDAILKFLDYGYSDEGSELINWGEEGVSFTRTADGGYAWTDTGLRIPNSNSVISLLSMLSPQEGLAEDHEL